MLYMCCQQRWARDMIRHEARQLHVYNICMYLFTVMLHACTCMYKRKKRSSKYYVVIAHDYHLAIRPVSTTCIKYTLCIIKQLNITVNDPVLLC
jgi:hypothetical protein